MNEIELVLLLLVVVAALTPLARTVRVPYPILLVLGGLILALLPMVPNVPLAPDLVFLLFLPPLVYSAAINASARDFKVLWQPILALAVGLVLATMLAVAVVLHTLMPDLGWPLAFAFGAIVAPPDAVAAVAVFRGLGVPRKVVALLEGESLINDATALVAYGAALGAATMAFSATEAAMQFVFVGAGGILLGLAVGWLVAQLERRLNDPPVEVTLSLLTPFAAYLPAAALGVSGVLATVTAGLYLGWRAPYISESEARLRGSAVWEMVDFLLNGLVFILVGLQLSTILPTLAGPSLLAGIGLGLLVSLTLILVRLVWVMGYGYLRIWMGRVWPFRRAGQAPPPIPPDKWRELLVVGWAGMRGVVSLAAVLALPQGTAERNLLIFLTFFVILATLVGQGLSLPLLIRKLGLGSDSRAIAHQEYHARQTATEAALTRIEELRDEWPGHLPLIDTLRTQYDHRASHLVHPAGEADSPPTDGAPPTAPESAAEVEQELVEHHRIRRAVIDAQRSAVLNLRERGQLDDGIWREIERDLDLEELRMDA